MLHNLNFKKYYTNDKFSWNYWKSSEQSSTGIASVVEKPFDLCSIEFPDLVNAVKELKEEFPSATIKLVTKNTNESTLISGTNRIKAWVDAKFFTLGDDAHFNFLYLQDFNSENKEDALASYTNNITNNMQFIAANAYGYSSINSSITLPQLGVGQTVYINNVGSQVVAISGTNITLANGSSLTI